MISEKIEISVLAFGIAKDILGASSLKFTIGIGEAVGDLKRKIISQHPEFEKLTSFSVAVNQEYQEDDYVLNSTDEVAIIPPVSGG